MQCRVSLLPQPQRLKKARPFNRQLYLFARARKRDAARARNNTFKKKSRRARENIEHFKKETPRAPATTLKETPQS
jgi:4-alpha-glucanotransferase